VEFNRGEAQVRQKGFGVGRAYWNRSSSSKMGGDRPRRAGRGGCKKLGTYKTLSGHEVSLLSEQKRYEIPECFCPVRGKKRHQEGVRQTAHPISLSVRRRAKGRRLREKFTLLTQNLKSAQWGGRVRRKGLRGGTGGWRGRHKEETRWPEMLRPGNR